MSAIYTDPATSSLAAFCAATGTYIAVEWSDNDGDDDEARNWPYIRIVIWRKDHGEYRLGASVTDPQQTATDIFQALVETLRIVEANDFKKFRARYPSLSVKTCHNAFERTKKKIPRVRALFGDWYDVLINEVEL